MNFIGADVWEHQAYVPARFKVICTVRPKLACTECEAPVPGGAPAGSRNLAIATGSLGRAGATRGKADGATRLMGGAPSLTISETLKAKRARFSQKS